MSSYKITTGYKQRIQRNETSTKHTEQGEAQT